MGGIRTVGSVRRMPARDPAGQCFSPTPSRPCPHSTPLTPSQPHQPHQPHRPLPNPFPTPSQPHPSPIPAPSQPTPSPPPSHHSIPSSTLSHPPPPTLLPPQHGHRVLASTEWLHRADPPMGSQNRPGPLGLQRLRLHRRVIKLRNGRKGRRAVHAVRLTGLSPPNQPASGLGLLQRLPCGLRPERLDRGIQGVLPGRDAARTGCPDGTATVSRGAAVAPDCSVLGSDALVALPEGAAARRGEVRPAAAAYATRADETFPQAGGESGLRSLGSCSLGGWNMGEEPGGVAVWGVGIWLRTLG